MGRLLTCRYGSFEIIARLKVDGMAVILVEQMVGRALSVAHRGYVLQTGRLVAEASSAELHGDAAVRAAYLGAVPA